MAFAGAATFAQTDDSAGPPFQQGLDGDGNGRPFFNGHRGNGRPDFAGERGHKGEALAEALGITVEELEAAHDEAKEAALAQAVADGLISQEEADAILAGEARPRGLGRQAGIDGQAFLADALGISVEELEAAIEQVQADRLAAMVEAGAITQEQGMLTARQAVESYVDREALQDMMQAAIEEAINEALADGAITQEQADTLLSNVENFEGRGFGGRGFGGRGGHHHGPRGGAGFVPEGQPDTTNTDLDA